MKHEIDKERVKIKMIIGSKISYRIYDGGDGHMDKEVLIGYCKENPCEVLEKLIKTHCIHSYKTSYCRPIEEYPSNCNGLIIYPVESENMKGISIIGSLSDMMQDENMRRSEWDKFSKDKFQIVIDEKYKYAEHFEDSNSYKNIYREIVRDWKEVINHIN